MRGYVLVAIVSFFFGAVAAIESDEEIGNEIKAELVDIRGVVIPDGFSTSVAEIDGNTIYIGKVLDNYCYFTKEYDLITSMSCNPLSN